MRALNRLLLAAVCILLACLSSEAQAQESNGAYIAYTFAGQASAPNTYTPSAAYTFNPEGGVTVSRTGIGVYAVRFANLAPVFRDRTTSAEGEAGGAGHVQVTTYNTPGAYCKTNGWGESGSTLLVNVNCFDASGDPLNARFTVLFLEPAIHAGELGFVWANDATSSSYTPAGKWAFNGAGGDVQVDHSSTGFYTVRFSDMARYVEPANPLGGVHVTGYGFDNTKCQATGWSISGDEVRVFVLCREPGGALKDGRFTLMTLWPGAEVGTHAYAWGNQPTASGAYTPASAYNEGRPVTVSPLGTGEYRVRFSGLGSRITGGHVQVASRADPRTTCQVENWAPDGSDLRVDVRCTNEAGNPANAQFVVSAFDGEAPTSVSSDVTVDFSELPDGTLLENQLNDQGLRFDEGALVIACASDDAVCSRSRSARNVIVPVDRSTEFRREDLSIRFGAAQTEVRASLNSAVRDGMGRDVRMVALSQSGDIVDEATGTMGGDPGWTTRLTVAAANIWRVEITSSLRGATENDNQIILDDLTYTDTTPWAPDVTPPLVQIWNATGGGVLPSGKVYTESPIDFDIRAQDSGGLVNVTSEVTRVSDGAFVQPPIQLCGSVGTGPCGTSFQQTVAVSVSAPGAYLIRVRATDTAGLSRLATRPVLFDPADPPPLAFVHKVEFNQGVTNRLYDRTILPPQDVFIVPGKDLLVRYYLHSEEAARADFSAVMRVGIDKDTGTPINRTIAPNAGAATVDIAPLPEDVGTVRRDTLVGMRADASRTLNFVIPGEWFEDAVLTEIELWDGTRNLSQAQIRDSRDNASVLALQLVYVEDEESGDRVSRETYDTEVLPYLEKALPYGDVRVVSERTVLYDGYTLPFVGRCETLIFLLSMEPDVFGPGGRPTERYWHSKVMLGNNPTIDCAGLGYTDTQVFTRNAVSLPEGANVAHEVGHNTGLLHASMSHNEPNGQPWPYYHGAIGTPDITFGAIVLPEIPPSGLSAGMWSVSIVDPCPTRDPAERFPRCETLLDDADRHDTVPHELMSYGVSDGDQNSITAIPTTRGVWPSWDTYSHFYGMGTVESAPASRLLASAMDGATASARTLTEEPVDVLAVTVVVREDGESAVWPLMTRPLQPSQLVSQPSGEYLVELVGADERVLTQGTVGELQIGDADPSLTFVQAFLPFVQGVEEVRITRDGAPVARGVASLSRPEVVVTSPARGDHVQGETLLIEWSGIDDDGDALHYVVEYSPNGGATWEHVTVVPPSVPTSYEMPTANLTDGVRGLVRVTASDGIHISRVLSQAFFSVGPEPPATANDAPDADAGDDQTVIAGQEVTLDGASSSDANDDALTFAWTLDGPGDPSLASAEAASSMFCAAEAGDYTATLTVNDGTVDSAPDATTITALSIDGGLEALIADINGLVAQGHLHRRLARLLTRRLEQARRLLGRGRSASAMLRSVRIRIWLLKRTGKLTPSQAAALRASVDAIRGAINEPCTVTEGVEASAPSVDLAEEIALGLALPRPNPTSGSALIPFGLDVEGAVRLAVYDALGREVAVLVNATVQSGNHAATFEANGMPAGVYVVRLVVDGVSAYTRRLTVVR